MKDKQDSQQVFVIKETKREPIRLWSDNFLSNWLFVWVFPIIKLGQEKNPLLFNFELRKQETARVNVDKLDQAWQRELQANPRYHFSYIAILRFTMHSKKSLGENIGLLLVTNLPRHSLPGLAHGIC